jgi:Gpi18-like mannosyltransferase
MLVRTVYFIIPSLLYSALVVAWASLVVALFFYIKLIKLLFKASPTDSIKAALFFMLFPTGIFLIATYSESLFAALSLAALYFALKKKYLIASLLLLFCTATHITGVFVVMLVALVLYEQKVRLWKIGLSVIVGMLGIGSYMLFDWRRFHNPFIFIKSQEEIHGWVHHSFTNLITSADALNVILIVMLIITAIYWWNKRRSFSVYTLSFFAIPLVGRQYGGFNRYVLMAFPLQFMLYEYFKKKTDARTYMYILMAAGWAYFVLEYAGGYVGS